MEIILHTQIRKLRQAKGQTQEHLANYLGVTVQAVSKWERGDGYPDLTTLPHIAEYFNVSIDTLLGFDDLQKRKRLQQYIEESDSLILEGKSTECVSLWRNAHIEFPNEPSVMHNLAFALRRDSMPDHSSEIIELSLKLLDTAMLSGQYFGAINNLCHAYLCQGRIDEAKAIAARAGRYHGTENQLLLHILDGEDAVAIAQSNIASLTDLIATNASMMLHKGSYTTEERIHITHQIIDLFSLIYDKNDFGFYHSRLSDLHLRAAKLYAEVGNADKARFHLQEAKSHAYQFDNLSKGNHVSLIMNRQTIDLGVLKTKQTAKIETALSDPIFDSVRNTLKKNRSPKASSE